MGGHTCHARNCSKEIPPRMFMCFRHWRMIPRRMQTALWDVYVPGQEARKDPTDEYLLIARDLIDYVAKKEGIDE